MIDYQNNANLKHLKMALGLSDAQVIEIMDVSPLPVGNYRIKGWLREPGAHIYFEHPPSFTFDRIDIYVEMSDHEFDAFCQEVVAWAGAC